MSSATTRKFEGQEAWSRLKKHMSWSDWTSVGRAHLKGRRAAMREANTNEPTGRRYNQIFGELTRHGFDDIDKGDRSRLFEVMEHLDEIETWLARTFSDSLYARARG
jgi:hypothetical protein